MSPSVTRATSSGTAKRYPCTSSTEASPTLLQHRRPLMARKFSVTRVSSVHGDLWRRSAASRASAFALAVKIPNERAADEACLDAPAMHGEVVDVKIEEDVG
jgi:hypothetical protein